MSYTKADYQSARERAGALALSRRQPGTAKELCPLCEGGAHAERSFALTVADDGASWAGFCHRASCKFSARGGGSASGAQCPPPASFTPRPYDGALRPVRRDWTPEPWNTRFKRALGKDYYAVLSEAGVRQCADDPREFVFPLWGTDHQRRGHISRRENEDGSRTVRTWRTEPGPVYSCYRPEVFTLARRGEGEVWLVEDHLSAIRLACYDDAPGAIAVALCGTNVSGDLVRELAPLWREYPRVYVALDPDASSEALRIALWLRNERGLDAWPVLLGDDIKNLPERTYHELRQYWSR